MTIPENYEQWKKCIVHDCKIALTSSFIHERMAILNQENHPFTVQFRNQYGQQHLSNILEWFAKAKIEILKHEN